MRKVVDSNFLQNKKLQKFLSASPNNYALLTDYVAMEAYKGNTLKSIPLSMSILVQYPKQVIILKSTQIICGLSGRSAGLQQRLIDKKQTKNFGIYCQDLIAAEKGSIPIQSKLLRLGHEATEHLDGVRNEAAQILDDFEGISKIFTNDELEVIRKKIPYTDDIIEKFNKNVLDTAFSLFKNHPQVSSPPPAKESINSFILRYALCANILVLRWIELGRQKGTKPEKLLNDVVDLNIATFSTYFDGLLTADKKLLSIYKEAVAWLIKRK